jgi:hypothetical protein
MKEILIPLLDEGTDVWRPVQAIQLEHNLFQIPEDTVVPDGEKWQFKPGAVVYCVETEPSDDVSLIAVEEK